MAGAGCAGLGVCRIRWRDGCLILYFLELLSLLNVHARYIAATQARYTPEKQWQQVVGGCTPQRHHSKCRARRLYLVYILVSRLSIYRVLTQLSAVHVQSKEHVLVVD